MWNIHGTQTDWIFHIQSVWVPWYLPCPLSLLFFTHLVSMWRKNMCSPCLCPYPIEVDINPCLYQSRSPVSSYKGHLLHLHILCTSHQPVLCTCMFSASVCQFVPVVCVIKHTCSPFFLFCFFLNLIYLLPKKLLAALG